MKRRFKGIWIPAELWLCPELSAQEKCLVAEVDSLDAEGRGCYARNAYLAEFFGVSVSRMAALIGDLSKRGWLRVELANGNERALFAGAKWIELSHTGNSNPTGNDNPPHTGNSKGGILETVTPNIERTNKDNTESANASSRELFSPSDLATFETPQKPKQTKAAQTKAANEAKAEIILAGYPRKTSNYKRDLTATVRALKRCEYPQLAQAVKDYAEHIAATKTDAKYILVAANFMDRERYLEDWKANTQFAKTHGAAPNVPTSGQRGGRVTSISLSERQAAQGGRE